MPRPPKITWDDRRKGWATRALGPYSEATGRRVGAINRGIGPPYGPEAARNRAAAQRWLEEELAREEQAIRRGSDPLLKDLVVRYMEAMAGRLAARTAEEYRRRLVLFLNHGAGRRALGEVPARDLKPGDWSRFQREMIAAGYAPLYVNSIRLSVDAMLNWAARPAEDRDPEVILAGGNPFRGAQRVKNPAPPRRYCGPEARRAFLRYAAARAHRHRPGTLLRRFDRLAVALFRFAEATGCRPDEACRLEWAHVDRDAATATLRGKSTGKTGRPRVLPLTADVLRLLRAIDRLPGRHGRYVFTHVRRDRGGGGDLAGAPWTANALAHKFRQWRDEAIAAGLPIEATGPGALTLYGFRRDLGADILRLTGSHAESAEVLGHSPEINARHYASFEAERPVDLVRKVANERRARRRAGGSGAGE